jgi:hypothetical protein
MRQVSNNLGPNLQQFKTFIITFWMRLTANATLEIRPLLAPVLPCGRFALMRIGDACLVLLDFEG